MGQLLLIFLLAWFVGGGLGSVWEFGEDRKDSVVVATSNGDIQLYEKNARVEFTVPSCIKVIYVMVQVDNPLSTPEVNYNKDTHTVIINYKLIQYSWSRYYAVAKGIKQKHCGKKKRKSKKRRYSSEESDERYDSYRHRNRHHEEPKNVYSYPNNNQMDKRLIYGPEGHVYTCITCHSYQ